VRARVCVSY